MATREKNIWILLVFLLAGLVIGGLLGKLASSVSWLWWLSYEQQFGLETPIVLDLSVLDRKSTRLNSSHREKSRMPSSA